jgi:hypothetical protein
MPDKDSQYKKVVFKEDRVPKGRSLAVIIEILQTAKSNRTDVSDLAMIEFAYKLLENRIMNEEWGHCDKSAKTISFRGLPPLGEPTHKEGDLIAWVVEVEDATFSGFKYHRCFSSAGFGWEYFQNCLLVHNCPRVSAVELGPGYLRGLISQSRSPAVLTERGHQENQNQDREDRCNHECRLGHLKTRHSPSLVQDSPAPDPKSPRSILFR